LESRTGNPNVMSGEGGGMADLWQFIDEIDADKQAMLAKRLEDRAQMPKFVAIRENYFDKIGLPVTGRVLELGCGTGAVCRAIASRPGFVGTVVGSDLSAKLIETAKNITAKSGLKNIEYCQADAQGSDTHDGQYDLVLAHTVVSHVADPAAFLREAIRLAKPGGQIILHDGDYASCAFDTNTPELDLKMPGLIIPVANKYVMRGIPRLLRQSDVEITHAFGDVVLEIGNGEFFPGLAKNLGPIAVRGGVILQAEFDRWIEAIDRTLSENTFFASCNFVTYGITKAS
jgi:2-polyprenyl-3-methyl-5-hydroxy-6-metoxy-1,4-benzoquinol methylase